MAKAQKTPNAAESEPSKTVKKKPTLTRPPEYQAFAFWIVGDTPLITHAWSEKAKQEMLAKQIKSVQPGLEARDPEQDFRNSLYRLPGDPPTYGFPAMAVKNAIVDVAHKDKGIPKTVVQKALYMRAPFVSTRPAFSSAICDMPMLRIYGSEPEMREDMVRLNGTTAGFAFRAQFSIWALRVTGRLNVDVLTQEQLGYLVTDAGMGSGIGDWRNERSGFFGAFHIATPEEMRSWENFSSGEGPMPQPQFDEAA